ncbi:MAG: hypothetical protein U0570_11850 [Phycisphaerales bacterium]
MQPEYLPTARALLSNEQIRWKLRETPTELIVEAPVMPGGLQLLWVILKLLTGAGLVYAFWEVGRRNSDRVWQVVGCIAAVIVLFDLSVTCIRQWRAAKRGQVLCLDQVRRDLILYRQRLKLAASDVRKIELADVAYLTNDTEGQGRYRYFHMLVHATIDEKPRAILVLDEGAAVKAIASRVARELRVPLLTSKYEWQKITGSRKVDDFGSGA